MVPALHHEEPGTRALAAEFLAQNYPLQARNAGIHKFIDPWLRLRLYHDGNLVNYTNPIAPLDSQPK